MKREEKKLAYREKHAEEAMLDICSKHMMLGANAVVKDGYRNGFDDGVKWADEHPNKKLVYTKSELIDMGFGFDLNGNIVTMNDIKEMDKRYREYRKQKMIERACEWLIDNAKNYIVVSEGGYWYDSVKLKQSFKKAMKGE